MKKLLLNIIFVMMSFNICAQESFSVTYDFQDNDIFPYPSFDVLFYKNNFYIISNHYCIADSAHFCTGLSKLSRNGKIIKKKLLDNFDYSAFNGVFPYNNKLLLSGHQNGNYHATTVIQVDTNLIKNRIFTTDSFNYSRQNLGMLSFKNDLYIYGETGYDSTGIYLTKINGTDFRVQWTKYFNLGINRFILDFDTTDTELVYVSQFDNRPAGANQDGDYEFEIMKLDTGGNTIDSFNLFEVDFDKVGYNNFICTDDSNNIYFTTEYTLTDGYNGSGVINKINHTLDSILWSVPLPESNIPILYLRQYWIKKIIQDGNSIVACGIVNSGRVNHPVGNILQGFIVKLTLSGKIQWIHFYRLPKIQSDNITGDYKFGTLLDIIENKRGGYAATGFIEYYTHDTIHRVDNWLLSVDENGCLEGEECSEVIVIDGKIDTLYNYYLVNPRNEWNILKTKNENGFIKKQTLRYRFASDTTVIDGKKYHELLSTESETGPIDYHTGTYYRQDIDKVWKWNPVEEELIYNFNQWTEGSYIMDIAGDTVHFLTKPPEVKRLIDSSRRRTLSLESADVKYMCNFKWIEGIGSLYGFPFDKNKCKKENFTAQLSCFYTDGKLLYKNEEISGCYTVSNEEIDLNNLKVYPNPVKNTLIIENYADILRVEIYNTVGQRMINIEDPENIVNVSQLSPGTYFMTLFLQDNNPLRMKFIKQ